LSEDNGQNWQKIVLPRGLDPHRPHRPDSPSAPALGCSRVGCVYDPWVRIGYGAARAEQGFPVADVAVRTSLSTPAYSALRATCFATGVENSVDARSLGALANGPVRHGVSIGYNKGLPANTARVDVAVGTSDDFWLLPAPRTKAGALAFELGHETPVDFRAYAWGPRAESWPHESAWLVRVAPRFGAGPVWSTAPTRTPWTGWVDAVQAFGADRAYSGSAEWSLTLDTEERAGLLRMGTRSSAELHWLEADKPTLSLGGSNLPKAVGVAKYDGAALVLVPREAELELYRLSSQGLRLLQRYPFSVGSNVNLIRTVDGSRLALWVQSLSGAWFIHPLNADFSPSEPVVIPASTLNRRAQACPENAKGWLVRSSVPLSRVGESDSSSVVTFASEGDETQGANDVDAKVIVGENAPCIVELAAEQTRPMHSTGSAIPTSATIPLSLRSPLQGTHRLFRCEL
jgi:hypothetical protein